MILKSYNCKMAEVKWTNEQNQAIYAKDNNILVAAAAGSGKTAVLVERIINKVINEKVDIDKILVVTFTNAAASEMRERILDAIYKKIEQDPENTDLQRQITLLNKASICTIDSFCLDVIRNNFYEINTSANFRVADTAEIEIMKQEVIDELFEEKYIKEDSKFIKLINTYTNYKGDEPLKQLILNIYKYIQSNPNPINWLKEKVEMFNVDINNQANFANTVWGKVILADYLDNLSDSIVRLKKLSKDLQKFDELIKYKIVVDNDIEKLQEISKNISDWDEIYKITNTNLFERWPSDKKITTSFKDEAKAVRDNIKSKIDKLNKKYLLYDSKQALSDIYQMYDILNEIKNLIIEFDNKFKLKKNEKNIVDFSDIEHFALEILVKEENGKIIETDVAKSYKNKFEEIAIDEYQDSNILQENILKSISKGNNIFMVGDVKQSIYKFRQARPELFLEKYKNYNFCKEITQNNDEQQLKNLKVLENSNYGVKIQLFKNFRSRQNILDITNIIFKNIMSYDFGSIEYNESEFLNLGADYKQPSQNMNYGGNAELHIIDLKDPEPDIYTKTEETQIDNSNDSDNNEEEQEEKIENVVLEAKFVANKIKQLIDSDYMVYDKKEGYRKIQYKDIVILLRATNMQAPIYEKELSELNMPVFSDSSGEYLSSYEIQVIMSVLKIIDNPMQDIPLITVLRSCIGGFTDNELIKIRLLDSKISFYQTLMKYQEDDEIKQKITRFLNNISKWQIQETYMALDELIWNIYEDTGFYHFVSLMPNGELRQANLKLLFEKAKQYESASLKGLFNFINFMDKINKSNGDVTSAKIIGESEDVIRIMSIHKSKGLEFPVVFLCGVGRQFNVMDLNDSIILHQDLGFGPKYINEERKIEYTTLAKEAIKIKLKNELLEEEMRVLYVALTRAKEKLFITGFAKDAENMILEKKKTLEMYNTSKISDKILKKCKSYLDWIQLIYLNDDELKSCMSMAIHKKKELLKQFLKGEKEQNESIFHKISNQLSNVNLKEVEELKNSMDWNYKYLSSTIIPTKTSITEIAHKNKKINNNQNIEIDILSEMPQFIAESKKITSAQKGTLMHLCFQKLDETKNYTLDDIKYFVHQLAQKDIITHEEESVVNIKALYNYTKSNLWEELKNAKQVAKELPFYININSNEIYDDGTNEEILVQGIIDLYYINQNNESILVDYKTDFVENEIELITRYSKQLNLYKKALENGLKKKIDKVYIYSSKLEKLILI